MGDFAPKQLFIEYGHDQQSGQRYWQIHDGADAICCNSFCYAADTEKYARLFVATNDLVHALKTVQATLPHIEGREMATASLMETVNAALAKAEASS